MNSKFKKNHFLVLKNVINKETSELLYNYMLVKKQVYDTCIEKKYISPFETMLGIYEKKNEQVPNTYCCYGDILMDTLLLKLQPIMEKNTGLKLNPTYSYTRVYKKGDVLKRHKDRFSCEISTTLNLGGDKWPIFLESKKNIGTTDDGFLSVTNNKGTKINLNSGDMLIYKGNIVEHWRESFTGNDCVQTFLHYNNVLTKNSDKNIFDGRPHIGLPDYFKDILNINKL